MSKELQSRVRVVVDGETFLLQTEANRGQMRREGIVWACRCLAHHMKVTNEDLLDMCAGDLLEIVERASEKPKP